MDWILITSYLLTILLVLLPITTIPNGIVGGFLGMLTKNFLISILIASLITWTIIDILWTKFVGVHIPILTYGLCFLTLVGHFHFHKEKLNDNAKLMITAEQWALVIICIYKMMVSDIIRWY
jgi:hypothetical protein